MFSQEEGLSEVHTLMESDSPNTELHLKQVLDELNIGCSKYVTISKASTNAPGCGKTKLDKERAKLCQREIVSAVIHVMRLRSYSVGVLGAYGKYGQKFTGAGDKEFI